MARSKYATDPYDIYVCARHGAARKDTALVTFYLCDACAAAFTVSAFNNTAPGFEGPLFEGHCALCNQPLKDIRLRQWYLCGVCERVARSMGRGRVSAAHVLHWWQENIIPVAPHLTLEQTDPIELRAVGTNAPAAGADFTATNTKDQTEVLTIELKTGRSAINGMSQFQLDTTDCDQITTVVEAKLIPGYLFHAQVVEQFDPPSSYFKAVGLWWSDIYRMSEAFSSVRRRQVEQRYAAFFKRAAFSPITAFVEEITVEKYLDLAERLRVDGVPSMYSVD